MKIIVRQEVIKSLRNYYHPQKLEFITLYGQCRVGETYLIERIVPTMVSNFNLPLFLNFTPLKSIILFYISEHE